MPPAPQPTARPVSPDPPCVLFVYAPWCGYCTQTKPEIAKLARRVKGSGVAVHRVNGDEPKNAPLLSHFKVDGFPTIIYIPPAPGRPKTYAGARTAEAIAAWIGA